MLATLRIVEACSRAASASARVRPQESAPSATARDPRTSAMGSLMTRTARRRASPAIGKLLALRADRRRPRYAATLAGSFIQRWRGAPPPRAWSGARPRAGQHGLMEAERVLFLHLFGRDQLIRREYFACPRIEPVERRFVEWQWLSRGEAGSEPPASFLHSPESESAVLRMRRDHLLNADSRHLLPRHAAAVKSISGWCGRL